MTGVVDVTDLIAWEFAYLMSLLWNERAGRAMHAEDRRHPEHVDIGGES